jgi:hypothetical protein
MMSSITYLQLDEDYDPIFLTQAALTDLQAVQQAIKTRILLLEGEWWEDLNEGTPMFQEILGARATPNGQEIMSQALAARISGTPYVTAVQNVTINFNPTTRAFSFKATVQTAFGVATVSYSPGALAGSQG